MKPHYSPFTITSYQTPWEQDPHINHEQHRVQPKGKGWKCACGQYTISAEQAAISPLPDLFDIHMQAVQADATAQRERN